MTTTSGPPDDLGGGPVRTAELTIGDVADRTGIGAATLRVWESRHGFPQPHRLPSGHRRYDESTVETVLDVQARRDRGVRLDVAITDAVAAAARGAEPSSPSVYAEVRRRHPALPVQRLRKSTLLALSWAIEDEFCQASPGAALFGGFQRDRNFEAARDRWRTLADVASTTYAFADFPSLDQPDPGILARVPLSETHPMLREWAVVVDSPELPVALSAWELPGQERVRDGDRIFESVWTLEPEAVRQAARVCTSVAVAAGLDGAQDLDARLEQPAGPPADPRATTALFHRVLAYVDRPGR